jgi:hypothetical protein
MFSVQLLGFHTDIPKDLDPEKRYLSRMAMLNSENGESGRGKA